MSPVRDASANRMGRQFDFAWRFDSLDPLQFLAAVFRLQVLLANVVPPDEVFHLGDFFLLALVRAPLHLDAFGLLLLIGGEVAGVRIDGALEQLPACACADLVEEVAISD